MSLETIYFLGNPNSYFYDNETGANNFPVPKKSVYRFEQDFGRMGVLSGIFVELDKVMVFLDGHTINFGEVLGKYSDISCVVEFNKNLFKLTEDTVIIDFFENNKLKIGINPYDYYENPYENYEEAYSEGDDDD